MEIAEGIFWVSAGIIIYTYIGYGLLAGFLGLFVRKKKFSPGYVPQPVTVIIPAYNEAVVLQAKIENTLKAIGPIPGSSVIVITDGSADGSETMQFTDPRVRHLHLAERKGKSAAINRAMKDVSTEIVIITDANAEINEEAVLLLSAHYQDSRIGGVSGEKRVQKEQGGSSTGTEGLYWQYESFLKKKSADLYTIVGAAGELFSFRRSLFVPLEEDAILDDFVLSLRIVKQGYRIAYEPGAYAIELPSKNIGDEFERKVRISSGVWQTLGRLCFLFNPFADFRLFFQFISHRFLRWTLGPLGLLVLFASNAMLTDKLFYKYFMLAQLLFYAFASVGFLLKNQKIKLPVFFVPFYFCMMNFAVLAGFIKYLSGNYSVLWKKADR